MIYICTLTSGNINVHTHTDLVDMLRSNPTYSYATVVGTYIQTLREGTAEAVLGTGAEYLGFIDSDMMFPKDAFEMLLSRDKDIIGANYINRVEQEKWTAIRNNACVASTGKTGIEEVDTIGMGVSLIKTDVLRKLPLPRFYMHWNYDYGYYVGEDVAFCELARKHGYKIWVDHDLSQNVHHIGEKKLGVENYILPEYLPPEIDGWMDSREVEWLYKQAKYMDSIAELGSWKGKSSHALASGCKGKVWCIDHWKGSVDTKLEEIAKTENIYVEFLKNTKQFKNINVLKMTTSEAANQFADKSLDMVFIDAGHTYAEVIEDINTWYPKTKKLLCGHDYNTVDFPEVVKAVNDRFGRPDGVFESIWFKAI